MALVFAIYAAVAFIGVRGMVAVIDDVIHNNTANADPITQTMTEDERNKRVAVSRAKATGQKEEVPKKEQPKVTTEPKVVLEEESSDEEPSATAKVD